MTNVDFEAGEIDELRIFVIDEQHRPRSQSWYFKSKGNGVYIGPAGPALKLSFHTDDGSACDGRNSQWGLLKDYLKMEAQLGTPKLPPLARWKRPETPSVGVVQVASIMFPTDFLRGTIPPFKSGLKRLPITLAPPGHAIEVGLFYSRADPPTTRTELENAERSCLDYFSLPSGENVALAWCVIPFDPALIPPPSKGVGHALSGAPKPGEAIENCGGVAYSIPPDGQMLTLVEINGATIKRNC